MSAGEKMLSLSFAGCGMIGSYNVGAGLAIKMHSDLFERSQWIGAVSAGCLTSVLGLMEVEKWQPYVKSMLEELVAQRRSLCTRITGPELKSFIELFVERIPEDLHKIASGKIHICATLVRNQKCHVMSEFKTREDLQDAIRCSSHIPYFSGMDIPKYQNKYAVDGVFSKNVITKDENTIVVCPFSGSKSSISPKNAISSLPVLNFSNMNLALEPANAARLFKTLYLVSIEETRELFKQGYEDAYEYLENHSLLVEGKEEKYGGVFTNFMSMFDEVNEKDTATKLPDNLLDYAEKKAESILKTFFG